VARTDRELRHPAAPCVCVTVFGISGFNLLNRRIDILAAANHPEIRQAIKFGAAALGASNTDLDFAANQIDEQTTGVAGLNNFLKGQGAALRHFLRQHRR